MLSVWSTTLLSPLAQAIAKIIGNVDALKWSGEPAGYGGTMAYMNGYIYKFGGYNTAMTSSFFRYSIANNVWADLTNTALGNKPSVGGYIGSAVIGTKMYVIGTGASFIEFSCYDRLNNTWTKLANHPVPWNYAAIGAINDKIYTAAGTGVYEYDPNTNIWTKVATTPDIGTGATGTAIGGKLYVYAFGGSGGTNKLYTYDPLIGWADGGATSFNITNSSASTTGDYVYVTGGVDKTSGVRSSVVYSFDTVKYTWTRVTASFSSARRHTPTVGADGAIYCYGGAAAGYLTEFVKVT